MKKHIKKLIAKEFVCEKEETHTYQPGYKYVYLIDPETGKYYMPNNGWEVTGEMLEELFHEVAPQDE